MIKEAYDGKERKELNVVFQFEPMNLDKQPGKHRWNLKKLNLVDLKDVMTKWQSSFDRDERPIFKMQYD